jgi:hypothetical protein
MFTHERFYSVLEDFLLLLVKCSPKVSGSQGTRIMVVFMQQDMWDVINGETLLVLLSEIADTLPQAARIVHEGLGLTVIDYETWKEKVRRQQEKDSKNDEPVND